MECSVGASPISRCGLMWSCLLLMLVVGLAGTSKADSLTTLHSFSAIISSSPFRGTNLDGIWPNTLLQARHGNFYGTAPFGGANGTGTIFKISPTGIFTTLHSFDATDSNYTNRNGAIPFAALIQAGDGNLYGTASEGGANGTGTIFRITPTGNFTTLYSFSARDSNNDNLDGAYPEAGLIQASDGDFYGTCNQGGANGSGTIFKITPSGIFTTLHSFSPQTDGAGPVGGLIQASDGNFYGPTPNGGSNGTGTIFKITPSGSFTTLHSFSSTSGTDGYYAWASLIQASDGNLYGTCYGGGANGNGTIYQITTSGAFTSLYSFSAASYDSTKGAFVNTDGANPVAGLIQASDGNLYGTALNRGPNGNGTIYQITTSGAFTTLYSFSAASYDSTKDAFVNLDGGGPVALIQASDGNLYGTARGGGANGTGTVFALDADLSLPTLNSLNPNRANAGGPAFTLTLNGAHFSASSVAFWTQGSAITFLSTTYVSSTQLKAEVPASLIAMAGNAVVKVFSADGDTSNSKSFPIKVTTLNLLSATLSKSSTGMYTASITLKNVGYKGAHSIEITRASLGSAVTSTTLPVSVGSIAAGVTGSTTLSFPASAAASGTVVYLKVSGTFTGDTFSGALKVTLP